MAALMPPAAATECERTGWTLLMMATVAPASAAASAARWPARPAPMMRTSCAGMAPSKGRACEPNSSTGRRRFGLRHGAHGELRRRSRRLERARRRGRGERAADLLDGHDAAQAVVAVEHHERAALAQAGGAEEVLDGRVRADGHLRPLAVVVPALGEVAGEAHRLPAGDGGVDALGAEQAAEAPGGRIGDREPRPAVAVEELVLGVDGGR